MNTNTTHMEYDRIKFDPGSSIWRGSSALDGNDGKIVVIGGQPLKRSEEISLQLQGY